MGILSALAAAAIVLAACGGQPITEPSAQPTAEPTTAEPTAEPTTAEPTAEPTVTLEVFFSNEGMGDPCGEVFAVPRAVDPDDPATGALVALLAGPTAAEVEQGYGGWFSARTEGMLRSLRVENGTARADFEDLRSVIPNASTSCGSQGLLAQLDSTLLQFPEVSHSLYSINGATAVFSEWLQLSAPPVTPPAPEPTASQGTPGTDLADGRHAAYLHRIDIAGRTLTVDVIQFLTGQEAEQAYRRDHPDDPYGPPNDYYILNVNPRLRTLDVAAEAQVRLVRLQEGQGADSKPGTWEELPDYLTGYTPEDERLSWNPFWITVSGGQITAIAEQYIP